MTTMARSKRIVLLAGALSLLAIVLWPGRSLPVFNQGEEPIIEEGWALTSLAAANSGECPNAQDVCVEWCTLVNGQAMPAGGALCCVPTALVGNNSFGDCVQRVN